MYRIDKTDTFNDALGALDDRQKKRVEIALELLAADPYKDSTVPYTIGDSDRRVRVYAAGRMLITYVVVDELLVLVALRLVHQDAEFDELTKGL